MNKQLTKKTIAIAASAALMASVALSGSAFAGGRVEAPPGKGKPDKQDPPKGTQTSVDVYSNCMIEGNTLTVFLTITDKNLDTDKSEALLTSVKVDGWVKTGPRDYEGPFDVWEWNPAESKDDRCTNDPDPYDANGNVIDAKGNTCTIILEDYSGYQGAKALDALTTVQTGDAGSKVEYYTQCKDSDLKLD